MNNPNGLLVSFGVFKIRGGQKKMSEYNELKQATKEIEVLKSEIKTLREQTNFVMNKLEKAIEDRIVLRAENFKLKQNMVQTQIAS